MEIHRQIWVLPFARNTEALEFGTLDINPTFSELSTFLAEIDDVHFVFVFAFFAVLLFYLPFNGQTVAIPTGDVTGIFAHHLLAAHNHIL